MSDIYKKNQAKQSEAWALMGAINRAAYLEKASADLAQLTSHSDKANRLFQHLTAQAERLDEVIHLTGATGESNDLYLAPRGKVMIVGTEQSDPIPVLGQLVAALLAGNEVILRYPSQQALCEQAIAALQDAGIYPGVMSIANDSQLTTLLHINGLAVVGVVGTVAEARAIGQDLAETDGILTQLVAVTDMQGCQEMFEPEYVERFTTERVKTVNTTAIGGNASLIELGMG